MSDALLPSLPEDEVFQFEQFFPVPSYRSKSEYKPAHVDLLCSGGRDILIETCFLLFLKNFGPLVTSEDARKVLTKFLYYARQEFLREVFCDEDNFGIFIQFLQSFSIKEIVLGTAYIYILLERQCTPLKKYLLEKDVVRHIINLQKINETKDTFQLEAKQWISKRAALICEKHFSQHNINTPLYVAGEEFKNATKLFEEGNYIDAIKTFKKDLTTPGYGAHEMLSSRIIGSLLSYFLPSNKREGFNRARLFIEVLLSQNEIHMEETTEFDRNSRNLTAFSKLICGLVKCLDILLQRLDKEPERQEAMEKCQHTIVDVCYMSRCVVEDCLSEIIEKVMIMPDANGLEMETNVDKLSINCCPVLDKEDDSSVNMYNYCNLMKVGQLLNVLHSINNQWGTLMETDDIKPLLKEKIFQSNTIRVIPYRHDPWFYWTIVKKCPFLVFYRRRTRLFLKYQAEIKFMKDEDIQNEVYEPYIFEENDESMSIELENEDIEYNNFVDFDNFGYANIDDDNIDEDYIYDDHIDDDHIDDDYIDDDHIDDLHMIEDSIGQYRRNEYAEFLSDDTWRETEELDNSSQCLHVVSRQNILEDVAKIFSNNPNYKSLWNFVFQHESGSGHGLTKEFYTLFSKDVQKKGIGHWLGMPADEEGSHKDFISNGLFPSPLTCLMTEENEDSTMYFAILGKMLAKSLLDLQIMDIPLNRVLLKWLLSDHSGKRCMEVGDLKDIIPMQFDFFDQLVDIIKQKRQIQLRYSQNPEMLNEALDHLTLGGCNFEDWCLNFTLPLFPEIEMKEGGADTLLTPHNVEEYLRLVMYWFLVKGPRKILQTIKDGFESVAPLSLLKTFYIEELESLWCSNEFQPWTISELKEHCFHYNEPINTLEYLFEVLSSFNSEEQRMFLQFVTSYSKFPPGGFEGLQKQIKIYELRVEKPDDYLPTSSTCDNTLMIPNYSSLEITREKLLVAIREAENSFHEEDNFLQQ